MNKAKKIPINPPQPNEEDQLNSKKGEKHTNGQFKPGKQLDLEELIKIVEDEEKNKHLNF